jgi:hypothetical protein
MQSQTSMDTLITYDEVAVLIANPPSIAPRPNFTKFAQFTVPHPTRLTAPKLPPKQHTWVGWAHHGKSHVWPPHNVTIPAPYRPGSIGHLLRTPRADR